MSKKDNNDHSFLYVCGKCHGEIGKDDEICPHCGVRLGKIKCPYCGYTGEAGDFRKDICPKCGRRKTLSIPVGKPHYYRHSSAANVTEPKQAVHSNYKIGCIIMSIVFAVTVIVFLRYFSII